MAGGASKTPKKGTQGRAKRQRKQTEFFQPVDSPPPGAETTKEPMQVCL